MLHQPIAIVGMACRLPGADNLHEYWDLLASGRSAIGEMPADRLDRHLYYHGEKGLRGKTYSTLGGLIKDRPLDPDLCPIPAADLPFVDPCHAVLCEVASAAFRDAASQTDGRVPDRSPSGRTGVYVGHSGGSPLAGELAYASLAEETIDYLRDIPEFQNLSPGLQTDLMQSLVSRIRAGRPRRAKNDQTRYEANAAANLILSYLGLDGPQMVIDAACASSLVALAMGTLALQNGRIDRAVVAGASYAKCDSLILFSHAQSCTAVGSRPFDQDADGLVSSEGYVALVLKTLAQAEADGDRIHAVIQGLGMSSDGRGRSLWAPRKEGQMLALQRAYGKHLDPGTVQYVEAHATSTQVGDATELQSLAEFYAPHLANRKIPIGSVKSNIGHTLETAGLAGLLKTVLAMQHAVVPPTINVRNCNNSVDWDQIPFEIPHQPQSWNTEPAMPRRAGVSAFGIGGLNVHVVVEEYRSPKPPAAKLPSRHGVSHPSKTAGRSTEPDSDGIAIVGRGVVLPGAFTVEHLLELASSNRHAISPAPHRRWRDNIALPIEDGDPKTHDSRLGGFIDGYQYDWQRFKIPPKQIARANPLQFMLLDAAQQALDEAGYGDSNWDRHRAAVIVGTTFGGEFGNQLQIGLRLPELRHNLSILLADHHVPAAIAQQLIDHYEQLLLDAKPALLDETGSFTSSTLASRISKTLNLNGGALAIDAGEVSSQAALEAARDLLNSGTCSVVLCAGAQHAMDIVAYEAHARAGRLSAGSRDSGASHAPEKYVPGEGVALVLLKRVADAQRDGDRIFGVIRSVAAACDRQAPAMAVHRAAQRAWQDLAIQPAPNARVFAESPSRSKNHQGLESLRALYPHGDIRGHLPLASAIGHTQAAHGLVSVIHSTLDVNDSESEESVTEPPVTAIAANTFGGVSYHVVMTHSAAPWPPTATPVAPSPAIVASPVTRDSHSPSEHSPRSHGPMLSQSINDIVSLHDARPRWLIYRMSAHTIPELRSAIRAASDDPRRTWAGAAASSYEPQHELRLAIVADSHDTLNSRLALAARVEAHAARSGMEDQGVFFHDRRSSATKVAFMFSGQGSQYAGMLQDLVATSPAAKAAMELADRELVATHLPTYRELAWDSTNRLGSDSLATQLSVLLADWFLFSSLNELGIVPDAVTGHSFGEIPAMLAAGCWDIATAIRVTKARASAVASCATSGALLSVAASPEEVAHRIRDVEHEIYVTHHNSPLQTVVGGSHHALEALRKILASDGLSMQRLSVPAAMHTPLIAEAQLSLRNAVERESLQPPKIPLLSNISNLYVAEPRQIRDNLVHQLVTPVRYISLVERLLQDNFGILIEVGPGNVLTRLNRQIIEHAHRSDVIAMFTNHPQRSQQEQLARVEAALDCIGHYLVPESHLSGGVRPARTVTGRVASSVAAVLEFDATTVRKQRMRHRIQPPSDNPRSFEPSRLPTGGDRVEFAEPVAPPTTPVTRLLPGTTELSQFIVDFIVDQTGYPAEMIDFDWDLEADLGIDSIKKAQLFGELWDLVGLERPTADSGGASTLKLEDFATLRSILHHVQLVTAEKLSDIGTSGALVADCSTIPSPPPAEPMTLKAAPVPQASPRVTRREQALRFSIDFIVDQTGYPPEIVDLGADFEADLGMDSIKIAQLLGELSEQFAIAADATDRSQLLRFRSLSDVLQWVDEHPPETDHPVVEAAMPASPLPSNGHQPSRTIDGRTGTESTVAPATEAYQSRPNGSGNGTTCGTGIGTANRNGSDDRAGSSNGGSRGRELRDTMSQGVRLSIETVRATAVAPPQPIAPTTGTSSVAAHPAPVAATVTSRHSLCVAEAPKLGTPAARVAWHGAAVILGSGQLADALAARLANEQVPTTIIPATGDVEQLIASLNDAWTMAPAPHLFVTIGRDMVGQTSAAEATWHSRRETSITNPFWFCQRWMELVKSSQLMDDASIVTFVSLGGSFGFTDSIPQAEGGALSGMMKAIIIESWVAGHRTIPIKILDAPPKEPVETLVNGAMFELSHPSYDVEIAWSGNIRRVVRAEKRPVTPSDHPLLRPRGTWICTGGARGITAFVARELATRYRLTLHLLGTSPRPDIPENWRNMSADIQREEKLRVMHEARQQGDNPVKAWERAQKAIEIDATLRELKQLGVDVHYHACDIANRQRLSEVLEGVRRVSGEINGVLHGAGIGKDSRFEHKQREHVEKCLRAKLDGTLALMEATQQDHLEYFVAFGSISGRFGANGHTDYSLANEGMAKLVAWYRQQRPEVRATTFHWHAWGDIGMATKAETRLALEMIEMQFMPAEEGLSHLVRELEAGAPLPEVLITDNKYYRLFYPSETLSNEAASDGIERIPTPLFPHPPLKQSRRQTILGTTLDPQRDPFLTDHQMNGQPLLPIVVGLELLAECALRSLPGSFVRGFRDVRAERGLRFFTNRPQEVRVTANLQNEETAVCELRADFHNRDGLLVDADRRYLTGTVDLSLQAPTMEPRTAAPHHGEWHKVAYPPPDAPFFLGPTLRSLRRVQFDDGIVWGQCIAPALIELAGSHRTVNNWVVPCALLDACLYTTGLLAWHQIEPGVALPAAFDQLLVFAIPQPGDACLVESRISERGDGHATFDFDLWNAAGEWLLSASGYRIHWRQST
ncbi:MAG: SDR family NAD(P)-dependent oxidoreductase [Pirellulaceae bacterium]